MSVTRSSWIAVAALSSSLLGAAPAARPEPAPAHGQYRSFRVAIYVVVGATRQLAGRATFDRELDRGIPPAG